MDDLERELRRLRHETRAQQLDVEVAEAELESSTAHLTTVLRDWAAQGQLVRLDAIDRSRTGRVAHVGDSVVMLVNSDGASELVALGQVEGFTALGVNDAFDAGWTVGHPRSLVAHLRALVGATGAMTIERRSTDPVRGHVIGVADRHMTMRIASGEITVVPLDAIVAVATN